MGPCRREIWSQRIYSVIYVFCNSDHLMDLNNIRFLVKLYFCSFDNTARILDNKPKVSSCSVVATAKDSPQGEIKMAEDRFSKKPKRSMCSSSLYKSTLDDLVDEDKTANVMSTTEDLKVSNRYYLCSLSLSFYLSSIPFHCRRKLKSMACTSQQTREVSKLEPCSPLAALQSWW